MKHYYQLLQIAHLINQITEKLQKVKKNLEQSKMTIKALWQDIMASMQKENVSQEEIFSLLDKNKQLRY